MRASYLRFPRRRRRDRRGVSKVIRHLPPLECLVRDFPPAPDLFPAEQAARYRGDDWYLAAWRMRAAV